MKKAHPMYRAVLFASFILVVNLADAQPVVHDGCIVNGQPVDYRASVAIPDIALATVDRNTGERLIYYNPFVLSWLPLQLREWIYAHECAHHVLDHLRFGFVTAEQEVEADCWATSELTARGILSPRDIALMEDAIRRLLPRHWMHMPGRFRAIRLQRCVQYPAVAFRRSQTPP